MKSYYAKHQWNDGKEHSCVARRADETGYYGLRASSQKSKSYRIEACMLTATTVLKDQSKYPSLSPNAVRISAMSFVALVLTSPGPIFSKNAGSWGMMEATYV
jgi:hypothetical protein